MNITPPPLLPHLLFEQPWILVIALFCIAAILRVIAKQQNLKKINYAALVLALVAIAIIVLSFAIQTPREQLIAKTKKLVNATAPLNMNLLHEYIGPDISVISGEKVKIGEFSSFEGALKNYKITEQTVSQINAQAKGDKGLSKFTATTRFTQAQIPVRSKWALAWHRDKEGNWRVAKIYWLKLNLHDAPHRIPRGNSHRAFP